MILLVLLRSKACRWEFGYVRQPQLVHVYLPGGDKSPGRIVKWEELMDDAELCRRLFGEALQRSRNTRHGASCLFGNWLTTLPRTHLGRKVWRLLRVHMNSLQSTSRPDFQTGPKK